MRLRNAMASSPVPAPEEPELLELPSPCTPSPAQREAPPTLTSEANSWVRLLGNANWQVRVQAAEKLAALDDPAILACLVKNLQSNDFRIRRASSDALGKMGEAAIEPTAASLCHKSRDVRFAALSALQAIGPTAVAYLIGQLRARSRPVRRAAAEALGRLRSTDAVDPLIACLQDDDAEVRWRSATALGEIATPRAITPLRATLADAEPRVRLAAATALGSLVAQAAVEDLQTLLEDDDAQVCASAAWALGEIGDLRAVPALARRADAQEESIARAALLALGRLESPDAIAVLECTLLGSRQQQTIEALAQSNRPEALHALIGGLRHNDRDLCRNIGDALVHLGVRAAEPLQEFLSRGSNGWGQSAAREALDRIWQQRSI